MRTMKKAFALFLAAALLIGALPVFAAAGTVASGDYNGFAWSLDTDGLLTITGEGAMPQYTRTEDGPVYAWTAYADGVRAIVLGEGITSVNMYAFSGFRKLESVEFPESLLAVSYCAFEGCTSLSAIGLPAGLQVLDSYVFQSCTSLAQVTLPAGLKRLDSYAFAYCSSLTEIYVECDETVLVGDAFYRCAWYDAQPDGVLYFGDTAIGYKGPLYKGLRLIFREGTKKISGSAFREDIYEDSPHYLSSVWLPDSLTEIGSFAFYGCADLRSVYIPGGVTGIGQYAFGSAGLQTVTLPEGLKTIGDYAFEACPLASVRIPGSVSEVPYGAFVDCAQLRRVTVAEGVKTIGTAAFQGCGDLIEVRLPESLTEIGTNAFRSCGLTAVTIPDGVTVIGMAAFSECTALTDVKLPRGLTAIQRETFYHCPLTEVTIPAGVETIGIGAFLENKLTQVTLGRGVTSISSMAFVGNAELTDVYYDGDEADWSAITVGSGNAPLTGAALHYAAIIANGTFGTRPSRPWSLSEYGTLTVGERNSSTDRGIPSYGDPSETPWNAYADQILAVVVNGPIVAVGDYAFSGLPCLKTVSLAPSVSEISYFAFAEDPMLSAVDLSGVEIIAGNAFENCSSLSAVSFSDVLLQVGDYAFAGCTSLRSVVFSEGIDELNYYTFAGCTGLSSVMLPDSLRVIGQGVFSGCSSLETIEIPDGVWGISNSAFEDCTALSSITLPAGLQQLGYYLFADCTSLTSVVLPEGVTEICDYMFEGCTSLTSVALPGSVELIGEGAFKGCTALAAVDGCESLTWIGDEAFSGCSSLASFPFRFGLYDIGWRAFYGCAFTEVVIPGSVDTIGGYAFEDCAELTSVTVMDGVRRLAYCTFFNCSQLAGITLPDSLEYVGGIIMYGTAWKDAQPDGILYAGNVAIGYKGGALPAGTELKLREGTIGVAEEALAELDGLTSVVLPESVRWLAEGAFAWISTLERVTVGKGLQQVGNYAFDDCTNLTDVWYAGRQSQWDSIEILSDNEALTNAALHVTPEPLRAENVSLSSDTVVYNGNVRSPSVTVTNVYGEILTKDVDYTISVPAGRKDAGVYKYVVAGIGDYAGSVNKYFTIKANASQEVLLAENCAFSSSAVVYNGKVRTPTVTVKNAAGTVLTAGTDYTLTLPAGRQNAGEYVYVITGKGDYAGAYEKVFTIAPQPLAEANASFSSAVVAYNGLVRSPTVTVKNAAGTKLTAGTDYTVTVPAGRKNIGSYTYVIEGRGNYEGAVSKVFTINPQSLGVTNVTFSSATVVYNGKVRTPTVTVKNAAGETLTAGTDYSITVPEGRKNAGVYTYVVTGLGNYADTVEKLFTINAQTLTASNVTFSSAVVEYNGKQRTPTVTVKNAAGETLTAGTDYTLTVPSGRTAAGTYIYVVTGRGNYAGSVNKVFTINAQPLQSTGVSLSSVSVVYNGKQRSPTVTVKNAAGATLTAGVDYTVSLPDGRTNVGSYTYVITGKGNYAGSVNKVFKITAQPLSASNVTLSSTVVVYNGKQRSPTVTVKNAAGETLVSGTDYTLTVPSGRTDPGSYTYKVTGKGNYSGTVNKVFTINPAS